MHKCGLCKGKGLFPFCERCFKSSDVHVQHTIDARERQDRREKQSTDFDTRHWKDIARHKFLENCKDLKKMLQAALRSKKLLTGSEGANEIITGILAETVTQIHIEIDNEELVTYGQVISRFYELTGLTDKETSVNKLSDEEIAELKKNDD